jgi:hypothetical protein
VIDEVRIYDRALSQAEIQKDITTAISTYSAAPASQTVTAPATADVRVQRPGSASSPGVATSAQPRSVVSSISCSPRTVSAGGQTTCELRVTASQTPFELRLTSTSSQVKTPTVVYTRPNQSTLTFQATVEPAAKQLTWIPTAAQTGKYEISFVATNSARQTSTAQVTIEVDSGTPVWNGSEPLVCSPNAIADLTGQVAGRTRRHPLRSLCRLHGFGRHQGEGKRPLRTPYSRLSRRT